MGRPYLPLYLFFSMEFNFKLRMDSIYIYRREEYGRSSGLVDLLRASLQQLNLVNQDGFNKPR